MTQPLAQVAAWPALPLDTWKDTYATLHMWTQVVGKICLALTPRTNHFWNAAFRVTSSGLMTPTLTVGNRALTITFDFVAHRLVLQCSDGGLEVIPLEPRTVADFYAVVMEALRRLRIDVNIWTMPVEVSDPIRFELDTEHWSYEPTHANAFWRALLLMKPVFEQFRGRFVGKCSPVHFFWGSFDLAVTRFSGKRAPPQPSADMVSREAYSHEVISHGFWPGGGAIREAAFYAYAVPEPEGLRKVDVSPPTAYYSTVLSEFILRYETVRTAESPAATLTEFLDTTYNQAATLAGWSRSELERA